MIILSNTVIDPVAMMVISGNTCFTDITMDRSRRFFSDAYKTYIFQRDIRLGIKVIGIRFVYFFSLGYQKRQIKYQKEHIAYNLCI